MGVFEKVFVLSIPNESELKKEYIVYYLDKHLSWKLHKLLFASTETWSTYVHSIYPLLSHPYFIHHCLRAGTGVNLYYNLKCLVRL